MSKLTLAFSRVILSKDYAVYQCRLIALAQQTLWQVHLQRSQVLTKTFGLRVEACRGGDTLAQQALKHEVDGADARQRVAVYRVLACFWHQLLQFFNCQVLLQPGPSLWLRVRVGGVVGAGVGAGVVKWLDWRLI